MSAGPLLDPRPPRPPSRPGTLWGSLVGPLLSTLLLGGCTSTPLLEVRFDDDTPGMPPSTTQQLGTLQLENGAGSIVVVETPRRDVTPPDKRWARLSHPTPGTPQTSLRASLPAPAGLGDITVSTLLYVPSDGSVPTIQLEPFAVPGSSDASILHVDLLTDGTLRIDDRPETFGRFPHDRVFMLSIHLDVTETGATARVAPVGAGTRGSSVVEIATHGLAQQLGAVRVWMGDPLGGQLYVDDLVVVKRD